MIGPTMVKEDTYVLLHLEQKDTIVPLFEEISTKVENDAKSDFKRQFTKDLWSDIVITDDGSTGTQQETQQ